jgi:hypothetical protein
MVTWALFEVKDSGRRFYYYNTHFPYRDQDEPARTRAAQEIAGRLKTLPANLPFVLTGDFNTTPDSPAHALLTQTLQDARTSADSRSGPDATFHDFTGKPDRRIDWILYRGFHATALHTVTTSHGGRYPSRRTVVGRSVPLAIQTLRNVPMGCGRPNVQSPSVSAGFVSRRRQVRLRLSRRQRNRPRE